MLRTRRLSNVGVEVLNFDINDPLSEDVELELKSLFYEYGLLLFRNQESDVEQQLEFSRIFGALQDHPVAKRRVSEHPELFLVEGGGSNDGIHTTYWDGEPWVGRLAWHQDLIYTGEPNHAAVLRAIVVPEEGGLTGFGDLALLFDALDEETKTLLSDVNVTYTFHLRHCDQRFTEKEGHEPGPENVTDPADIGALDYPDSTYPAISRHSITGRKILKVSETLLERIEEPEKVGLSFEQSDDLLRRLIDHTRQSGYHYFHRWSQNDMILWDNERMMHCTTGTKPRVKRLMHRTTIIGPQASQSTA